MEQNAQGALEYLLLIAAAVVIVAVVIMAMVGGLGQGKNQGDQARTDNNAQLTKLNCLKDCNYYGPCTTTKGCGKYAPDLCTPNNPDTNACISK